MGALLNTLLKVNIKLEARTEHVETAGILLFTYSSYRFNNLKYANFYL